MEQNLKQTRSVEGLQQNSAETELAINPLSRHNRQPIYWGVSCRTCREVVAFDIAPYASFGPGVASTRPGAIRCRLGHTSIYFPRDFQFLSSGVAVPDEVMQKNRDTFKAINPANPRRTQSPRSSAIPVAPSEDGPLDLAGLSLNPRKIAEAAAKVRWAEWANKKAV